MDDRSPEGPGERVGDLKSAAERAGVRIDLDELVDCDEATLDLLVAFLSGEQCRN